MTSYNPRAREIQFYLEAIGGPCSLARKAADDLTDLVDRGSGR